MEKTKKVLLLYQLLKSGQAVKIDAFCNEYKISIPTFRRYLSLVRDFMWETSLEEIVYDINKKAYLKKIIN